MIFSHGARTILQAILDRDLVTAWAHADNREFEQFADAIETLTGEQVIVCEDCGEPAWGEESATGPNGQVCADCLADYTRCDRCSDLLSDDDTYIVDDTSYCEGCRDYRCSWCEECQEWYHDENSDDHYHTPPQCDCDAPHRQFRFPANGHGTVAQNERLTVTLPAGMIDPQGIREIHSAVFRGMIAIAAPAARNSLLQTMDEIGPEWQTRRGNFTKRLQRALYEKSGVKMDPELVSKVGNIAREHAAKTSAWAVEFTRDLNGPPEEFANEDSCWWGSYGDARCALKNWGGLAMRSYNGTADRTNPEGRVWVQPLDADLTPTHDTTGAHAYLVYNGYGDLDAYLPARIVAHLTGRSYRKIALSLSPQYINGNGGYLVADQATCDDTDNVTFTAGCHHTTDAYLETA